MSRGEILALLVIVAVVGTAIALVPTRQRDEVTGPRLAGWSKVVDQPDTRLSLTWAGPPIAPSAKDGTWIETMVEDRFNIDVHPVFMDWSSYNNRRPLMFSSGEIPDVCWDGDPLPFRRNLQHGFALEVPYDVIVRYAPTYVRNLNQYGREAWLFSSYRGRNYGIPTFAASDVFPYPGIWRMDWLRKVGITKVPDTIDELHDAMLRLRDGNLTGTGPRSIYGMCPALQWSVAFADIFAAYDILPMDFIRRDGKVLWGGVQPECKPTIAMLHQWYQEGLIDPDFIVGTAGSSPTDDKFGNGRTAYVYNYKGWDDLDLSNPNSLYSRLRQIYPEAELAAAAPFAGTDGKRHSRVWGGPGHVIWFGPQVAQHPEKAIRVLRMFEAFAQDNELFLASRLGQRGTHWEWSGKRGVYTLPPYDAPDADKRNLIGIGSLENCYGFYSCCSSPLSFTNALLPDGKAAFRQQYARPEWGLRNAIGKSDVVDSAGDCLEDLRQFQTTSYVQFIRGDRSIDEFDQFVQEWYRRGGERLTAEANAMNQELQRIERIVGAQEDSR